MQIDMCPHPSSYLVTYTSLERQLCSFRNAHMHTHRQAESERDRHTDREADRERQKDRHTDTHKERERIKYLNISKVSRKRDYQKI